MDLETVKVMLSEYGLSIISVIAENGNSALFNCRNNDGQEIRAGIKDGQIVFVPS